MAERLLLFQYRNITLGIPAHLTREVIELGTFTPLPGGAGGLAGLTLVGGRAIPLLDLHRLAGLPRHRTSLGLVARFGEQELVLPMDEVTGNLDTDESLMTSDAISAPQDPADYRFDGEVRVVNPDALVSTLQARITPV